MPRRSPRVLILYNNPAGSAKEGGVAFAESQAGVLDEVEAVARACQQRKIPQDRWAVRRFSDVTQVLAGCDHDVVFNLVEGFVEHPEQACYVPAVAAALDKACTGNETPGLLLSLDKFKSKAVLQGLGLPCPQGRVFSPGQEIRFSHFFEGPYIVKPLWSDASEGIDNRSIVSSKGRRLKEAILRVHEQTRQPALVEEYIEGRELNVSVIWKQGKPQVLPLAEIDFSAFGADRPRIVGYQAKWKADSFEYNHTPRIIPAPLPVKLAERIRFLAISACQALDCRDYCRVDFRVSRAGQPYILEVNANPDISPDAGFAAALAAAGISFQTFVHISIENALDRLDTKGKSTVPVHRNYDNTSGISENQLRWTRPEDRDVILSFLAESNMFRPNELDIAREVIDAALHDGPGGHYQSFVLEQSGRTVGWVCYGPTPCTVGTYDLYWIGVAPDCQKQGLGKALMALAEKNISACGGHLVIVETSGRQAYEPTRLFYESLRYDVCAQIADFYGPADDKVVFSKKLSAEPKGR
ncbi:MAG: GNAT family N-acetyltransferase [Sedimentisphaerales bacterium]|nr:GNAT family N-acetyltransferase [Sedimentisphaerales bacterium]